MKIYDKKLARDFLYPINKKNITSFYKMALETLSIICTPTSFRCGPVKRPLMNSFLNYNRIYGNVTGLHLKIHNKERIDIKISTLITPTYGNSIDDFLFKQLKSYLLFHKLHHFSKDKYRELSLEELAFGHLPLDLITETVTVKRMRIKLGSVKTKHSSFYDFFNFYK